MIRVLLDQGLPRSAAEHLRNAGWDALHAAEIGLHQASDAIILEQARDDDRIVVTLDADFHALMAVQGHVSPSVIRIRIEGLKGLEIAELLLRIWPTIESAVVKGALVTITARHIRFRSLPI